MTNLLSFLNADKTLLDLVNASLGRTTRMLSDEIGGSNAQEPSASTPLQPVTPKTSPAPSNDSADDKSFPKCSTRDLIRNEELPSNVTIKQFQKSSQV